MSEAAVVLEPVRVETDVRMVHVSGLREVEVAADVGGKVVTLR